jgi:hypothetical protein
MTTYLREAEHGSDGWHMTATTGSSKGSWPIGFCRQEADRGEYHPTAEEARACWDRFRIAKAAEQAPDASLMDDEQRRCHVPDCDVWTQRQVAVRDPYCWDVWWLCDDHLDAESIERAIAGLIDQ